MNNLFALEKQLISYSLGKQWIFKSVISNIVGWVEL